VVRGAARQAAMASSLNHGQTAALAQGSIVCRPIREFVLLLRDVMAAILVQLERHAGYPRSGEGQTSYAPRFRALSAGSVHQGPMQHNQQTRTAPNGQSRTELRYRKLILYHIPVAKHVAPLPMRAANVTRSIVLSVSVRRTRRPCPVLGSDSTTIQKADLLCQKAIAAFSL
jgi:hypothetical protein